MPLALVFDVETTGLLPKYNGAPLSEFPHIIQFSFVLYDTDTGVKRLYNEYIKIDDNVDLSTKITEITGITREIVDSRGIHVCQALQEFFHAYMEADVLVGHNLEFDMKMVLAESARWGLTQIIDTFEDRCRMGNKDRDPKKLFDTRNPHFYCTMMNGIEMCKLERTNSRGPYLKQPKLSELYQHIFKTDAPEGLHNSLIDVLVCLRCYMDMGHQVRLGDDMFAELFILCK